MSRMMKKLMITMVSVMALCFAGLPGTVSAQDVIKLKLGFVDPDSSNYAAGGRKIAEEVAKATDGKVLIEVYAGGQLGNERDMFEGAQIGSIDMCTVVNAVLSSFIPELSVLDQPFLFDTVDQAHRAIDGKLGALVAEKAKVQGVHIIGWLESGFRNVFSNRPVTKLESFRGLKIRTMENKMHVAAFNALGALGTPMAAGELFTALQQGTIDAAENAVANVLASRYYEVTKDVTFTNHLYTFIAIGVSDKAWNRIPNDLKPKVMEGVNKGIAYQRQLLLDYNAEAVVKLKELGVQFHEIDRESLKAVVVPALAPFRKTMNKDWLAAVEEAKLN